MRKAIIVSAVVLLLGAIASPFLFGPTDEQMIAEALREAVLASKEGRPGGVMQYLSRSLKYNDEDVYDRATVADYIKRSRPEVTVTDPRPTINGNTATIVSPVDVNLVYGPVAFPIHLDRAEITFAKETGTRFLILPAPKWRIREIKAPEIDVSQLMK